MATPDLIRIVNDDDQPLILNGNERYEIAPGGERVVPFTIAASWFGDPRSRDTDKERERTDIYRQVRMLWGYSEGIIYHENPRDLDSPVIGWDDMKPKVTCYDMDGTEIPFVIHDPEGTSIMGGGISEATTPSGDDKRIRELESQVAQLVRALEASVPNPATIGPTAGSDSDTDVVDTTTLPSAPTGSDVITDDAPRAPRTGARKAKKAAATAAS